MEPALVFLHCDGKADLEDRQLIQLGFTGPVCKLELLGCIIPAPYFPTEAQVSA